MRDFPDNVTENHLHDVQAIANELRDGASGAGRPPATPGEAVERGKVISVGRHDAIKAAGRMADPHAALQSMPSAVPQASIVQIQEEFGRIGRQLQEIRKSVEFTEAHLSVNLRKVHDESGALPLDMSKTGEHAYKRTLRLAILANLICISILGAEIHSQAASRAAAGLFTMAEEIIAPYYRKLAART
jgi:hypothetical protein